ncbi:MAG TPA: zinc-ribbon domain-containing protein [Streptosporangiaceae bacterium]
MKTYAGVALLIIWGLRVFFRTIGQGVFHCQRCGGDRQYRLRSGRRFIMVFFIPIIPLNKVGAHVQCAACGTRYHADVLNLPTAARRAGAGELAAMAGWPASAVRHANLGGNAARAAAS